ncbi:hypothetical protein L6R50_19840 [Myxococcota bacterium]|nr:hypothetical protein [Myxococcota bacterium]
MATETSKPRRFALSIVGAEEDRPRLIRAYGKACGGEFALVLRPDNARGVLVHLAKGGASATFWKGEGQDAPEAPAFAITPAEAVALVRTEQKALPKAGPALLRGTWRGHMLCDDERPRLFLERRIATYGTLRIESRPGEGWKWAFSRAERWFSGAGEANGEGVPTLGQAIDQAVAGAMRLVSEACSFRDTRKRAAVDAEYAQAHPLRPPRERKDPTERLKEPAPRKNKKKAAAPPPPAATVEEGIASGFGLTGMPGVTVVPPADAEPPLDLPEGPKELRRIAEITRKDAQALAGLAEWERGWKTTAEATLHLQRARALIRHGQALVRSPLCRGAERDEAIAAVRRATDAYEAARKALAEGRTWDAARQVRHVGEKVALAAARAAKSCGAGQTSLGLTGKRPETAPPHPRASKPGKVRDTELPRRPPAPARAPAPAPVASAEADPEKDKALLDAFASAIQAALAGRPAA